MVGGSVPEPAAGANGRRRVLAAVVLAVAFVAVASYAAGFAKPWSLNSDHDDFDLTVAAAPGRIEFWCVLHDDPDFSRRNGCLWVAALDPAMSAAMSTTIGFGRASFVGRDIEGIRDHNYGVAAPGWLILIGCLVASIRVVERCRPTIAGRCPACGYDLRATPGRCPECGRVPA